MALTDQGRQPRCYSLTSGASVSLDKVASQWGQIGLSYSVDGAMIAKVRNGGSAYTVANRF